MDPVMLGHARPISSGPWAQQPEDHHPHDAPAFDAAFGSPGFGDYKSKDFDQDSGRLSILDSQSQHSLYNETLSPTGSPLSLSPANSVDRLHEAASVDNLGVGDKQPDRSRYKQKRRERIKSSVKAIKEKLLRVTRNNSELLDGTILAIPPEKTVLQWFDEMKEVMDPQNEHEELELHDSIGSDEVSGQLHRIPTHAVVLYVDCLQKCIDSGRANVPPSDRKHLNDGISPISYILRRLKLDLKLSPDSFVVDFLEAPNKGMLLLIQLLREIMQAEQQLGTLTNRRSKPDQYKKSLTDEYDCLLCIKFTLRIKNAIKELLTISYGLETIAQCLISSFSKARITTLEILTDCLVGPDGLSQVLDAFTFLRLKFSESTRFKMLVSMLNSQGSVYAVFQTACMKFLNSLLDTATSSNTRVYLQREMELAGLDMDHLEKNTNEEGAEFTKLRHEIEEWKAKYINVESLQESQVSAQNRNALLRQEVDLLQDRVKMLNTVNKDLENQLKQATEETESFKERVFELQDAVEKIMSLYKDKTGQNAEKTMVLGNVMKPVDVSSSLSHHDSHLSLTSCAPAAPPMPPLLGICGKMSTIKRKIEPKVRLPMLNWLPLPNVESTVFQKLDEDHIYKEVDFCDFESKFQLKGKASKPLDEKKIKMQKSQELKVLDSTRARNLIITQRRIGYTAREIRNLIEHFDIEQLPGEYAELLVKFVPTKEEMKALAKFSVDYNHLDEAEQLLYQLAQVERCETKLKVMSFIGQFADMVGQIKPQIEGIYQASKALLSNQHVRKLFEVILAFGNYMNGTRRGFIAGFKLESLEKLADIKSKDKSQTLLQYLVDVTMKYYPCVQNWYDGLYLDIPRPASFQSVASDVHGLRKGIDLVKLEREKQKTGNVILQRFYTEASAEVHSTFENFKHMEESYKEVCAMFGENYKAVEPGQFFRYFSNFAAHFKSAVDKKITKQVLVKIPAGQVLRKGQVFLNSDKEIITVNGLPTEHEKQLNDEGVKEEWFQQKNKVISNCNAHRVLEHDDSITSNQPFFKQWHDKDKQGLVRAEKLQGQLASTMITQNPFSMQGNTERRKISAERLKMFSAGHCENKNGAVPVETSKPVVDKVDSVLPKSAPCCSHLVVDSELSLSDFDSCENYGGSQLSEGVTNF